MRNGALEKKERRYYGRYLRWLYLLWLYLLCHCAYYGHTSYGAFEKQERRATRYGYTYYGAALLAMATLTMAPPYSLYLLWL